MHLYRTTYPYTFPLTNHSSEIALTGANLNEIIEIHKKNNIERLPKQIIVKSLVGQ